MSPLNDIESDLLEVQTLRYNPASQMTARLRGLQCPQPIERVFLTGANPFILKADRLLTIAQLIHTYIPSVTSIGCFARITDSVNKTDEELQKLRQAGYNRLTIGVETGIEYGFFYLTGISGKGNGVAGAKATAQIINQLHPFLVGPNMLTIYPDSELYQEIQKNRWTAESETEKYEEIKTLIQELTIPVAFAAMGASNAFQLYGHLPQDKEKLLSVVDQILSEVGEEKLRQYREHLPHL